MSQTSDSKATADKGDADNNWRKSGGKAVGDRDSTVSAGGGVRDSGRGGGSYRSRDGAANDKVGGNWRGRGGGGSDKDRGDDRGGSWRGGARNEDRGGNDRAFRGSDRSNGNDKYGGNKRTEGEGNRSKDEKFGSFSQKPGDRQRLQLKQRTSPGEGVSTENNQTDERSKKVTTQAPSSDKPTDVESPTPQIPAAVSQDEIETEKESPQVPSDEKKEKKKREPEVMNSRAAAMGSVSEGKRESNNRREPRTDRGPPPILNSRFAAMADEEREKIAAEKDDRRSAPHSSTNSRFAKASEADRSNRNVDEKGTPAPANTRFAKAAEADRSTRDDVTNSKFSKNAGDRGPPLVQNSRFAAVAEADGSGNRSNFSREDRGPPPVQNSRFAAAAEADGAGNRSNISREDRGPPPVQNSRFAAAAEADGAGNRSSFSRDDRGPPPVQNSRFSAVAEADGSGNRSSFSRDDRGPPAVQNSRFSAAAEADGSGNRSSFSRDDRGPPAVQNSRFANAAAMAESERDTDGEKRFRNNNDRGSSDRRGQSDMRGPPLQQNSRFAAAAAADSDYVDRENRTQDRERNDRGGSDRNDRGGRGSRYGGRDEQPIRTELPRGPAARFEDSQPELSSRVEQLLKPKSKTEETVIIPPTKEHEANMFKIPAKALSRDDDDNVLVPLRKKGNEKKADGEVSKPEGTAETPQISSVSTEKVQALLNEFVHGGRLGDELKSWCENSGFIFPAVEKVIFYLLNEKEKLNPDPDCKWADPAQYGAALLFLVNDDLFNQMQVLWAIQLYCDKLGFPKLDGEYIVQSMFRSMYKFDLVADQAFSEWKDDESDVHEKGKMTAVIQTVEWFNWLEQEDQDEEEEEEEEEE